MANVNDRRHQYSKRSAHQATEHASRDNLSCVGRYSHRFNKHANVTPGIIYTQSNNLKSWKYNLTHSLHYHHIDQH
jgi:hypothetical protein